MGTKLKIAACTVLNNTRLDQVYLYLFNHYTLLVKTRTVGGAGRDALFNDGVLGCVFSLPKSFRQLGGIILLPIFKALIMVVEASFKIGFTTTIIILSNAI